MDKVTIIMMLASIGFIIMGSFILFSKSLRANMDTVSSYKLIRQNATMNILVGIIGVVIATIGIFMNQWIKVLIIIFIIMIAILSISQYILGKKYRN